eukprot:6183616-Pleurochrysis_carterae.AAC.1
MDDRKASRANVRPRRNARRVAPTFAAADAPIGHPSHVMHTTLPLYCDQRSKAAKKGWAQALLMIRLICSRSFP